MHSIKFGLFLPTDDFAKARPAAEWVALLTAAGVPAGPINDIPAAFAFAEALGLEPVVEAHGLRLVRSPLRLSATPPETRRPPPALGEHDVDIRAWLADRPAPGC